MTVTRTCKKCSGAVFHYRDYDCEGNVVLSIRCWNGHIFHLEIEGIENIKPVKKIEHIGKKEDIVAYIGFFSGGHLA